MSYEQIKAEKRDDVLLLTLNRPERLNAWTPRMSAELSEAIMEANDDAAIGSIVVTGEGRGFCSGADIKDTFQSQLEGPSAEAAPAEPRREVDWVTLVRSSKPMVAAVNGPSIGVGLTMILPFDYLIASDRARLSCRFVKMGLVPELASSHFLPQRLGLGVASDLMLSGRMLEAEEAQRLGLVDEVANSVEDLGPRVAAFCRSFSRAAPSAIALAKRASRDLDEVRALADCFHKLECREGMTAFLEKRPASWMEGWNV